MKKYFSENYWADQDIQLLVGKILRTGVSLASVTVLLGGILYLMNHGTQFLPDYSQFKGESNSNTTLGGILSGVLHLQAAQMIQLGVVFRLCSQLYDGLLLKLLIAIFRAFQWFCSFLEKAVVLRCNLLQEFLRAVFTPSIALVNFFPIRCLS